MVSLIHLETTYEVVELVKFIFDLSDEQQTKLLKDISELKKKKVILLYINDGVIRFGDLEEYRASKEKILYTISIEKKEKQYTILMTK